MRVSFTYKKKTYSLDILATPAQRLKWDEVMHYLNHLPEFVNEVFDEQQMKNIKEEVWNYVKISSMANQHHFGFKKGTKVNQRN